MKNLINHIAKGSTIDPADLGYLIIIALPKGQRSEAAASALCKITGIKLEEVTILLERELPTLLARILADQGPQSVALLRRHGFRADWIPRAELDAHLEVRMAKRITPAVGAPVPMYMVEVWREPEPTGITASQIRLLVRGQGRTSSTTGSQTSKHGAIAGGLGGLGFYDDTTLLAGSGAADETAAAANRKIVTVEYLDIHLRDGTVLRCDGSRFHFAQVGERKGYSDMENMDLLTTRLGTDAEDAIVDTQFNTRRVPPPVLLDLRAITSGTGETRTPQVFFAYSAWVSSLTLRDAHWS